MAKLYHKVFISICVGSFIFSIITASFGLWFIFQNPDKQIAVVAIESVSALGFFLARWSQQTFMKLYREAAYDDLVAMLVNSAHTQNSSEIFKQLMKSVIDSRGDVIKKAEDIKDAI